MIKRYVMLNAYLCNSATPVEEETGQDLIEYALLLGFVAVVTVAVIQGIGTSITAIFNIAAAAIP